jgi:hypothetical protein
MQCEYYALEGLSDLANTIKKVSANNVAIYRLWRCWWGRNGSWWSWCTQPF